jgi:hypothetical protein
MGRGLDAMTGGPEAASARAIFIGRRGLVRSYT